MEKRTQIKPLTLKQERFCMKYIETGSKSDAYRYAYDAENMKNETIHKRARETLKKPKIAEKIEIMKEKERKRSQITIDQKKQWLQEVIERCLQHEEVKDKDGNGTGLYQFGASDVIRAVNELNKMDGDHAAAKVAMGGSNDMPPVQTVELSKDDYIAARQAMIEKDDC